MALQTSLIEGLRAVIDSYNPSQPIASTSKSAQSTLAAQINKIWSSLDLPSIPPAPPSLPKDASKEDVEERRKVDRVRDRPIDIVRGVLEVVGRDIIIGPIVSGRPQKGAGDNEVTAFQRELQFRLDVVLTVYEAASSHYSDITPLDAGTLFVPILEELVELLSIDMWRELWSYVETRAARYTRNMLPSRGKALGLLRIFNTLTRFLPRTPEDIAFKGRIWEFASRTIGITDRSAVNFRGEFNHYPTTWDETPETEGDGDVKMEKANASSNGKDGEEYDLYPTLWSLQEYFSYPPLLAQRSKNRRPFDHFDDFKKKTDFVLPKLFEETEKEKEAFIRDKENGQIGKRKRGEHEEEKAFFHPRYLTDKRLLQYQLKDASFRRQILTQYFILFQFLLNLTSETKGKQAYTGGMPKDFELKEDDSKWIRSKIQAIRGDLLKMPEGGSRFDNVLLSIIGHEHFYAAWKNEACSEAFFEMPQPEQPLFERKIYTLPAQRLQPLNVKYYQPGSKPMPIPVTAYTIEEQGEDDDLDSPEWQRMTKRIRKLKEEMEDDEAMGQLEPGKKTAYEEKIEDLNYRAMRLARQVVDSKFFELNKDKTSVLSLDDTIRAVEAGEDLSVPAFEDEVEEWLPMPEKKEEEKKNDMEVDEGEKITEEQASGDQKDPEDAADAVKDDEEEVAAKEEEEENAEAKETAQAEDVENATEDVTGDNEAREEAEDGDTITQEEHTNLEPKDEEDDGQPADAETKPEDTINVEDMPDTAEETLTVAQTPQTAATPVEEGGTPDDIQQSEAEVAPDHIVEEEMAE